MVRLESVIAVNYLPWQNLHRMRPQIIRSGGPQPAEDRLVVRQVVFRFYGLGLNPSLP